MVGSRRVVLVVFVSLVASACGGTAGTPAGEDQAPSGAEDLAGDPTVDGAEVPDGSAWDALAADGADPRVGLSLVLEAPDSVSQGACARVRVELRASGGGAQAAPVGLALVVDGPSEVFSDEQCQTPLAGALALPIGQSEVMVWARWLSPGPGVVRVTEAVLGQSEGVVEVPARVDPGAAGRRALVVYNQNAPGAASVAEYYRQARGLDAAQVCAVRLPPGMVATPAELLSARRTIVESCICPLLPAAVRPSPCLVSAAAAIAAVSPISHLVLIGGMPQRLTGTGWTTDNEGPSLAPFLASLVYRDVAIFGDDTKRRIVHAYPNNSPISLYPAALDPASFPWTAFGQVQASSTERTRRLIDRTLAAEAEGFVGNIAVGESATSPLSQFLRGLTSSWAPECVDYLGHQPFVFGAPESSWPYDVCRYGSTYSSVSSAPAGSLPGEIGTTIPFPVGIGLSLATTPWPNTQVGFDGFDVMRRWHRAEAGPSCVELCREHATPAEVAACRARSTDVFGELDTDCVGVASGMLGYQLRSWPVQFMGFMPAGWTTRESGELVKSVPRAIAGGGYKDARFGDDRFIRFGTLDPGATDPLCAGESGGEVPCPERVVALIDKVVVPATPLELSGGQRSFTLKVRYRNPPSPGGALEAWAVFGANGAEQWSVSWTLLDSARTEWTTLESTHVAQSSSLNGATVLPRVSVVLRVTPQKAARGWIDFDGVELIDDATGQHLIDVATGSFARDDHELNVPGDFAATLIDRLGGIGAWGSSSHFMTGGWAFSQMSRAMPMFFAGRTLGESLLAAGNLESGLVYADPLYRPVAVRLRGAGGQSTVSFVDAAGWDAARHFSMSAIVGSGHLDDLRWALETCTLADEASCQNQLGWTVRRKGVGAVEDGAVDVGDLVTIGTAPETTRIRLRAWRPGDEGHALSSVVRVDHESPK